MTTLDDWTDSLRAELGLESDAAVQKTVLNLARVAAHLVDRTAAPLTAYYLGLAVGRGESLEDTAARIQQAARAWHASHPGSEEH
jgi:hypothetical protein